MQKIKSTISYVAYKPHHAQAFHDLNMEWILHYFVVEEKDSHVLSNPQKYILDPGGQIIMAIDENQEAIGTVAMIKMDAQHVELSKMAVLPSHQGLGIGKKLIEHVISKSKLQDYKSVILYSNRRLTPAIHLYRKLGFKEIKLENYIVYDRCDIKMKLDL